MARNDFVFAPRLLSDNFVPIILLGVMAKSPRIPPSQGELDKSVEDIVYVMSQCSTYFVWWVHIKPKLTGHVHADCAHMTIIHNGVVEATLLFVRKLNEFFRERPKVDEKDDDLRAYDFPGFKAVGPFLHPGDYEQLHKRVGHMTLQQVRSGKVSWEIHNAVKLALAKSVSFLDFLVDDLYSSNADRREYVSSARGALLRLSKEMEKAKAI